MAQWVQDPMWSVQVTLVARVRSLAWDRPHAMDVTKRKKQINRINKTSTLKIWILNPSVGIKTSLQKKKRKKKNMEFPSWLSG